MPKRTDINKIIIIGSGPIVIGQACEFDYSGTQACKALRDEGYETVLVNSNPATIMTDPELAERTYIEPLTTEYLEKIIAVEKPQALLSTVGGQTGLNASVALAEAGILEKYGVELIGANYPQAFERAKRLRSVLNAIYLREHSLEVSSLDGAGKREIREYYETLNGITPFVCNRVIALQYGVAAMPVDDRTLAALITNNLIHEDADIEETVSWLGRQVKADEVCDVHARIHAWVSLQPLRTISNPTTKKVPKKTTATSANGKKKTAKKTATKKKATVTKKKKKK